MRLRGFSSQRPMPPTLWTLKRCSTLKSVMVLLGLYRQPPVFHRQLKYRLPNHHEILVLSIATCPIALYGALTELRSWLVYSD